MNPSAPPDMSGMDVLGLHLSNPSQAKHPYASSISSSASSSSSSVFSLDAQSSISSTATNPVDVIWENDVDGQLAGRNVTCPRAFKGLPKADGSVPPELRMHPRRTNNTAANGPAARPPPCLLRQSERKVNFVDNLVGKSCRILFFNFLRLNTHFPPPKIRRRRSLKTSGRCRPRHPAAMPRPGQKGFFPCGRSFRKRSVARAPAIVLCRSLYTI